MRKMGRGRRGGSRRKKCRGKTMWQGREKKIEEDKEEWKGEKSEKKLWRKGKFRK